MYTVSVDPCSPNVHLGGLSSYMRELRAQLTGNHMFAQLPLAVLRAFGPGQSTALHSTENRLPDRSYRSTVIDFYVFFLSFFLKERKKKCSRRDTRLNKLSLGFIPGITWIFKNFWKSCLSATALLSSMDYLPNSFQALEFTVKREIKKSFICS